MPCNKPVRVIWVRFKCFTKVGWAGFSAHRLLSIKCGEQKMQS